MEIDQTMKEKAQSGWKGDQAKERVIQNFLHKLVHKDVAAMQALFEIIKNQPGY
jgi:type I restriction enzyme R subunit